MSDQADAGSVVAEPSAGTPATPTDAPANGSTGATETNPFSGLSEGTRKWVETKGYKTLDDALAGGMNAESRLGAAITVPPADAPPEEWEKFHNRLPEDLRPVKSADAIEYKRPENLPADIPYSEELATASKQWAVEAGVSPKAAQAYHDKFVSYMAEQVMAQNAAIAQSVENTHDALVKDWGPVESEAYQAKLEMANRTAKKLDLVETFKEKGILLQDGALTDARIAKAFAMIGETMFKDDTLADTGIPGGFNPFKKDARGERNVTAIAALVKSDPERAKRMAREAGENPDLWMPNNPL
jgi:hypothetical protein